MQKAKAVGTDSLMYFKNNGQKVKFKDSADFYRVILPPDTNADKDLYRVFEFYSNGKPKEVATALTQDVNPILDGTCIEYFPNGKRKSTSKFKNG